MHGGSPKVDSISSPFVNREETVASQNLTFSNSHILAHPVNNSNANHQQIVHKSAPKQRNVSIEESKQQTDLLTLLSEIKALRFEQARAMVEIKALQADKNY